MNVQLITKNKKFTTFFWTQFLGAFNDNFFKNALVVIIAFRSVQLMGLGSEDIVALAGGIFILPYFLFSPLAGQIADKFEKSQIIRITKLVEVLIMAVAALGFILKSYELLLFVLFLMGTQSAFFGPVKFSVIPKLLNKDQLMEGNAFVELGTFMAILLGTITGGLVSSLKHADYYIAAGLVFCAAFGYFVSRFIPTTDVADSKLKVQLNPFPEFVRLFKITKKNKVVLNSVLGISWFWFFGAGVLSILPIFVKDQLNANQQVVTLFLALFTFGIGLGSILCEKMSFKRVEIGLVPIGSIGMTICLIDLYFSYSAIIFPELTTINILEFVKLSGGLRLLIDFFLMSAFGGLFIVPLYTLLQERSDSSVLSRVIASNNILNAIFMVISSLTVMLFYKLNLNTVEILLCFAILNLIVSVYIYSIIPEFTLRLYSWMLSHVMYKVEVKGRENIPNQGACILAANHVSFIDWLILAGISNRPPLFVMYYKFFNIPILRSLFKQAKAIPIAGAKEAPTILKHAFTLINKGLNENEMVIIFPEGQLTTNGKMNVFKNGITKMVESNKCPVVPVAIKGLWGSVFSKSSDKKYSFKRRKIVVKILPPLDPEDFELNILESKIAKQLDQSWPPNELEDEAANS